jgi:pimeloyl-ACP methyl ester carboxylesterase
MANTPNGGGSIQGAARVVDAGAGQPVHLLEGGTGPALLLLHAAGGGGMWLPSHAALARHFRVIAPDHPGFSNTPEIPAVETVEDIAYLYRGLLDALQLEQVAVLGTSFGGWIAAELALLEPRVRQLVLVNAVGLRVPGSPIADLFAMDPAQKAAALFHDAEAARRIFGGEPDVETIIQIHRNERAFARYAWEPYCCNPRLSRRLPWIAARTLVLLGAHDRVVPRAHGELYASKIPNARLQVMPDAGHALLHERAEAGVAAIERFLLS